MPIRSTLSGTGNDGFNGNIANKSYGRVKCKDEERTTNLESRPTEEKNKTRYNKMMDTQHVSYVSKKRVKCKKNNYM